MYRVFLSHSSKDHLTAKQLHVYLEHPQSFALPSALPFPKALEVFLSEYDLAPGPGLDQRIHEALKKADLFLLLLSQSARESPYVNQEIGIAVERGIPRLIVALEPIDPPAMIVRDNYVRLYEDPDHWSEWLKKQIDALAASKSQREGVWVILGAVGFLWWLSKSGK